MAHLGSLRAPSALRGIIPKLLAYKDVACCSLCGTPRLGGVGPGPRTSPPRSEGQDYLAIDIKRTGGSRDQDMLDDDKYSQL